MEDKRQSPGEQQGAPLREGLGRQAHVLKRDMHEKLQPSNVHSFAHKPTVTKARVSWAFPEQRSTLDVVQPVSEFWV